MTLSPRLQSRIQAIQKEKKRCIPKEGMPHAQKACQKKREKMHTQRRYATHPQGVSKKREREREKENIAHTKNITTEREFI